MTASSLPTKMQGLIVDIPMPTESRKERITRERAEAEAAKKAAKAAKGQPITKAKASLVDPDATITVIPQKQQKVIFDVPKAWKTIKKNFRKHKLMNSLVAAFIISIAIISLYVSLDTPDIQDQAREQAQTHQGNEAATPITITKNPAVTTEKAKDTVKVPGIPVTPKETTQSPTQPETTEAIKQVPVDTYIIAAGDTLWDIAVDIYGDGSRWTEIYEKNKDTINALDSRNAVDHGHWIHEGITLQLE